MTEKLKKPLTFETTFTSYVVSEVLGEGGSGRVYGGTGADGESVALKVLKEDGVTTDKRKRFRNEISFLQRNSHRNIVSVLDHGLIQGKYKSLPFYVMPRSNHTLRLAMDQRIPTAIALPTFAKILDGVEAAHLQRVVHRDLKPENILCNTELTDIRVADFGVARFTDELLLTLVETADAKRLANFQYAAPEQRVRGRSVEASADIFALGLILNEMFTGEIPQGTGYKTIGSVSADHAILDSIVATLISQEPRQRPSSIADVKHLINVRSAEALTQQRLSEIDATVIPEGEISDPLALAPPKLIDVDWRDGQITLTLDRPVHQAWINALYEMRTYGAISGKPPVSFTIRDDRLSRCLSLGLGPKSSPSHTLTATSTNLMTASAPPAIAPTATPICFALSHRPLACAALMRK